MPNPQIDKVNVNGTLYDIIDSTSPAASISASDITNWNNKVDSQSEYNNETTQIINEGGAINTTAWGSNQALSIHLDSQSLTIHDPIGEIEYIHIYPYSGGSDEFVHITSVQTPVLPKDAVNKQYVDASIAAIDIPTVPSNVSAFNNDAGYISSVTSADISNALGYTPTSNTGTVTSVALSNGGGLSINGSPITTSGTITIGHSNSVTAQTTQAIYPIKIDAQGHVSAYGSAVSIPSTAADINAVAISAVGASSGVAPLNASGKIDSTYLPSYVDDVIEGYYYNSKFYKESTHTTEITGETGKIYIDLSTDKVYRYGGTAYVEIAQGSLVSVTRDLNSGTQIGTITINGTGTSLYAPTPPSKVSELSNDSGFITGISAADVSTALGYTPTSNTGTVTSVAASAGTGISISGSPITSTGTITIGHSNSVTAQTTEAVYPIKIDAQGHISSYGSAVSITDTKVTQTPLNGLNSGKGLLLSKGTGTNESTGTVYTTDKISYNDSNAILYIHNTDRTKYGYLTYNSLVLGNTNNTYRQYLQGNSTATGDATISLPSSTGTLALTDDIPTPYNSSTNPSGYLRLSDLPIYDGTVQTGT